MPPRKVNDQFLDDIDKKIAELQAKKQAAVNSDKAKKKAAYDKRSLKLGDALQKAVEAGKISKAKVGELLGPFVSMKWDKELLRDYLDAADAEAEKVEL